MPWCRNRRSRLALLLGSLALLVGGVVVIGQGADRSPRSPDGQKGRIVLVRDQRLLVRDGPDGQETVLKQASAGQVYLHPRWSPDGTRIAYTIDTLFAVGANWGADVAVSQATGTDERIVRHRRAPGTQVNGIAWSADSTALYLGLVEPSMATGTVTYTVHLVRRDLATGTETTVIDGGALPAVAPDGERIAFTTYSTDPERSPGGLWTARPDGSNRQLVVRQVGSTPAATAPQFSPDGQLLAFSAVAVARPAAPRPAGLRRFVQWLRPRPAAAHGLPMDVFVVPSAGGTPKQLTDIGEDEPVPAWAPDGQELLVLATGGLYRVPASGGAARKVGTGAYNGQVDWR